MKFMGVDIDPIIIQTLAEMIFILSAIFGFLALIYYDPMNLSKKLKSEDNND